MASEDVTSLPMYARAALLAGVAADDYTVDIDDDGLAEPELAD